MVDHNVLSLYHSFSTQNPVLRHTKVNKWEEVENWELIHKNYSLYDPGTKQNFLLTTHGGIQDIFHSVDIFDARCPAAHKRPFRPLERAQSSFTIFLVYKSWIDYLI